MDPIKKEAIENSKLNKGDSVAIFGCGTGMEFSQIIEFIGVEGSLIAVDYSPQMLKIAQDKISENKWQNIKLIEGDIRSIEIPQVDCIFCTLCLSIIEDWELVVNNLLRSVKAGGTIVIGDMQLAS